MFLLDVRHDRRLHGILCAVDRRYIQYGGMVQLAVVSVGFKLGDGGVQLMVSSDRVPG